jgi:hypothetical protein
LRTDPKSEEYFNVAERKGGPIHPLTHFDAVFETLFKGDKHYKSYMDYPLYKYLDLLSNKQGTSQQSPIPVHDSAKEPQATSTED